MPTLKFKTKLFEATDITGKNKILVGALPKNISSKLSSRGPVMVEGFVNGTKFTQPLEPDNKGSHLVVIDSALSKTSKAKLGDTIEFSIEQTKDWPEPKVPADIKKDIATNAITAESWNDITPMARYDWIRWIGSTKNPETRQKRIQVTISKLSSGKRRPCCFNKTACNLIY